ncbi:UNVERIFIED_CONTAM: Integrin-linked protein kinase 1 [Sesamum indicum]
MESKLQRRFTLGRQSSGAPGNDAALASDVSVSVEEELDSGVRLMYSANEGDLEGIEELLDSGTTVNFRDIDGRTALHVAACQGRTDVVDLLLRRGAEVDVKDRWGSTGDFGAYLKRRGALKLTTAIKFALDIARGMNYLHEHKPEAIIHRDLEPSNILRDDSGHLKVADFGLSKLMKVAKTIREDKPSSCQQTSWRYAAPEVFRNEEYDTKVDVFSFALILQEMIEGCPPFPKRKEIEVAKAYVANERPPFEAPLKRYAHGLRQFAADPCWTISNLYLQTE